MVNDRLGQALSALADGHASPDDWREIEAAWPDDPALRARWAEMAWIGDGLRSNELLRQRCPEGELLAALPQTRAPLPAPSRIARGRDWWATVAVAAGFALVALLVPRLRSDETPEQVAAQPTPTSLSGPSFAQTALGRSPGAWSHLPSAPGVREAGLEVAPPLDFGLPPALWAAPLPQASQPQRRP